MTVSQYLANERVIVEFHIIPSLVMYANPSKTTVIHHRIDPIRQMQVEVGNNLICCTVVALAH